jgi:transcriptional regulator with XRE-family HTH domain
MKKKRGTMTQDTSSTDTEIRAAVGRRVAEIRHKLGLSALRVSAELGISREAVTHIENGRNNVNAVSLWKLATLFHCDVQDFFPTVPDGYGLTKIDTDKIEQEGGEKAARWARELFIRKEK